MCGLFYCDILKSLKNVSFLNTALTVSDTQACLRSNSVLLKAFWYYR